jgi:hypothetical protein
MIADAGLPYVDAAISLPLINMCLSLVSYGFENQYLTAKRIDNDLVDLSDENQEMIRQNTELSLV